MIVCMETEQKSLCYVFNKFMLFVHSHGDWVVPIQGIAEMMKRATMMNNI
jgi:hypothetical protein